MPPSNSTRRVARAARSSGKRVSSNRAGRSLTFPIAVGLIILVGIVVVVAGRERRVDAATIRPQIGDHWHTAYGIYTCDNFIAPLTDTLEDTKGIHTHGDGVIHVHPFSSAAAGKKATLSQFFEMVNVQVSNDKVVLPSGETWENGKTCPNGKAGKWVLAKWKSADDQTTPPQIVTSDFGGVRLDGDRMAMTLAFVPDDEVANIPRPASVPTLDSLSDVGAGQGAATTTVPGAAASTDSTAPGSATTAAGGTPATETTVPGAAPTTATTAAGPTTTSSG
jgi:hypothetical protein